MMLGTAATVGDDGDPHTRTRVNRRTCRTTWTTTMTTTTAAQHEREEGPRSRVAARGTNALDTFAREAHSSPACGRLAHPGIHERTLANNARASAKPSVRTNATRATQTPSVGNERNRRGLSAHPAGQLLHFALGLLQLGVLLGHALICTACGLGMQPRTHDNIAHALFRCLRRSEHTAVRQQENEIRCMGGTPARIRTVVAMSRSPDVK